MEVHTKTFDKWINKLDQYIQDAKPVAVIRDNNRAQGSTHIYNDNRRYNDHSWLWGGSFWPSTSRTVHHHHYHEVSNGKTEKKTRSEKSNNNLEIILLVVGGILASGVTAFYYASKQEARVPYAVSKEDLQEAKNTLNGFKSLKDDGGDFKNAYATFENVVKIVEKQHIINEDRRNYNRNNFLCGLVLTASCVLGTFSILSGGSTLVPWIVLAGSLGGFSVNQGLHWNDRPKHDKLSYEVFHKKTSDLSLAEKTKNELKNLKVTLRISDQESPLPSAPPFSNLYPVLEKKA